MAAIYSEKRIGGKKFILLNKVWGKEEAREIAEQAKRYKGSTGKVGSVWKNVRIIKTGKTSGRSIEYGIYGIRVK